MNKKLRLLIIPIFIVSFLSLFWEIIFIRWLPSEIPFLAFFRSLVLLGCFLGLGIGCIAHQRVKLSSPFLHILFLAGILAVCIAVSAGGDTLKKRGFGENAEIIQQGTATVETEKRTPFSVNFSIEFEGDRGGGELVVLVTFMLMAAIFFPLGVSLARYFNAIEALSAYIINIAGALMGIGVFIGISFGMLSPPYWFIIGLIAIWIMLPRIIKWQAIFFALSIIILILVCHQNRFPTTIWSPYQRVSWSTYYTQLEDSPSLERTEALVAGPVFVNYEYHQNMCDFGFTKDPQIMQATLNTFDTYYNPNGGKPSIFYKSYTIPYLFTNPKKVLIIAAGCGNEAAAALRTGVPEVDAVEIDPAIIEIGKRIHPEQPYRDKRVKIICDDARAFLASSNKKYDLIVMNQVDSHSQIASSAGLRLDSYIFTMEFFEEVRSHLAPGGLFALEFSGFHYFYIAWSHQRIREILWRVFGYSRDQKPFRGSGGPLFLITPSQKPPSSEYNHSIHVSTDDWPQFYLKQPMIPVAYLCIIACILLALIGGMAVGNRNMPRRTDYHFLFLGAGFMLFEIKSVSELTLMIGSPWLVSSLVIATILFAILLANLVAMKFKNLRYAISYAILFVSLLFTMATTPHAILNLSLTGKIVVSFIRVAAPIFCAGLIFAVSFRQAKTSSVALGWNLIGSVFGGLGEYLSLIVGIHALGWYVIGLYALSLIALRRTGSQIQRGHTLLRIQPRKSGRNLRGFLSI